MFSRSDRAVAWAIVALLIGIFYALPLATIAAASFAGQWNGLWPEHTTLIHYIDAIHAPAIDTVRASLVTALVASAAALILGTWAALVTRALKPGAPRHLLDIVFYVPSAVPSISIGLGLLVAFSRPPLVLNGTTAIVIIAHLVIVSAFTYGSVSAGLARLSPDYEQVAESLGARPAYRLWHVTLPMISPHLIAAFSLSFALSMGELGATIMVYPPGWVTLPVGIFALTDRGDVFAGAALTIVLVLTAVAVLLSLSRLSAKVEFSQ